MTSEVQNLTPQLPPHSNNKNKEHEGDSNAATKDTVLSYLTKCGLASHSDISIDDIDESSMALLVELSLRHSAINDDTHTTGKSPEEYVEKNLMNIRGERVTKSEENDNDTDGGDYGDDAATAPTNQTVMVDGNIDDAKTAPTTVIVEKKHLWKTSDTNTTKKSSEMKETNEADCDNNIPSMPNRSMSSSSFKDKEDETRVQNLYAQYISIFGSIDANAKQTPANSKHTSQNLNTEIAPTEFKHNGFKSESNDEASALIQDTNSTKFDNISNDIRLQNLEPWQEAFFERQDRHEKALLQCQAKMDAIAKLFVAVSEQQDEYVKRLEKLYDGSQNHQQLPRQQQLGSDEKPDPKYSPMSILPPPSQQQQQQHQNLPPQQQPPRYLILGGIVSLFQLPRAIYNYISTARVIRLIVLIRREAERHPMPGGPNARFIDWNMILKIFFVFFVFGARTGHDGYKNGSGENDEGDTLFERIVKMWKIYRLHFFLVCALTTYMLQTGLGQFLYRVFVKDNIVRRVWRNEDLFEERSEQTGDERRGQNPLNNNDDAQPGDELGDPLQLGNRDGVNLRRGPLGGGVANGGGEMYRQFQRTFFSGAVARRHGANDINAPGNVDGEIEGEQRQLPNQNIHRIVDLVKDVVYLFGSMVLSLFPMWHPRAQLNPPHPVRVGFGVGAGADAAGIRGDAIDNRNHRNLANDTDDNAENIDDNIADGNDGLPRNLGDNET